MHQSIQQMLALQELDVEIHKLDEELRHYPALLDQLQKDSARRTEAISKLEAELATLGPKRRNLEADLQTREQRLAKFRKQQDMIKTSKELEALTHEINTTETEISRLEEEILLLMEQEERLNRDVTEKREASEHLQEKATEKENRIRTLQTEKSLLIEALRRDRTAAALQIDSDTLDVYEWLHKSHGSSAVARIERDACSGCGKLLVPHLVLDARLGSNLVQCTHCQRFLYGEATVE
jgi:uncharacterized protein